MWAIFVSPLLVPLVGRLLAVAGALGSDARYVLRRPGVGNLALLVGHLALGAAGRKALAEALHPAEETIHVPTHPIGRTREYERAERAAIIPARRPRGLRSSGSARDLPAPPRIARGRGRCARSNACRCTHTGTGSAAPGRARVPSRRYAHWPRGRRSLSAPSGNARIRAWPNPLPAAADWKQNASVGERERRLARNEALYREVNERVAEVADRFLEVEGQTPVSFICECGAVTCTEPIVTTLAEYEAIRSEPTRFAVIPGHELPEIETIVGRRSGYFVVEKRQKDAEEVARETDPRA